MSDPILTVQRRPLPGVDAHNILGTRAGIEALGHVLVADGVWRACTVPQRRLLTRLCAPLVARLLADGRLTAEDMPVVQAPSRTVEALQRRGMVDAGGRLTGRAVHAYYWTRKDGAS